jgi:pentatricopeptide repeat protein
MRFGSSWRRVWPQISSLTAASSPPASAQVRGGSSGRQSALSAAPASFTPLCASSFALAAACGLHLLPACLPAWLPAWLLVLPRPNTATPSLDTAAAAGEVEQAASLLDQLHEGGLVGNHALYHGVIGACQAAGRWELALEVFLGMQVGDGWVVGAGCWRGGCMLLLGALFGAAGCDWCSAPACFWQ